MNPLAVALATLIAFGAGQAPAQAPGQAPVQARVQAESVLRVAFPIAETGFDPQAAGDAYSNYVERAIFDPLYRYDYLARRYRLVPNTATALPEISPDGKTWIIHLRPGIYFAAGPTFQYPFAYLDVTPAGRESRP